MSDSQPTQLSLPGVPSTERPKGARPTKRELLADAQRQHALRSAKTHFLPSPQSATDPGTGSWVILCYSSNGAYAGGRHSSHGARVRMVLDTLLDVWKPQPGAYIIVRWRGHAWRTYVRQGTGWVAS